MKINISLDIHIWSLAAAATTARRMSMMRLEIIFGLEISGLHFEFFRGELLRNKFFLVL